MFFRSPQKSLLLALACLGLPLSAQSELEKTQFAEVEFYYNKGKEQTDGYEKGRYMTHVLGLYGTYLEAHPNSPNAPAALFHLGHAQQTLGKIPECRQSYKSLVNRFKKGAYVGSAARQLAYLAYVEDDFAEAAKYFEISAEHLSQVNLRYVSLTKQIECLIELNRTEELMDVLRRIIDTPGHPYMDWARFRLGFQYYETDEYEIALTVLAPLLEAEVPIEYRSQALFYTGLAAAELGREDVAEEHLVAVLDLPMNTPTLTAKERKFLPSNKGKAQTALMGLYFKKKDYQRVIDFYTKGDFGMTGRTEAQRAMRAGNSYFNLKKFQQARAAYRRVDRALPNTSSAFLASYRCLVCDYQMKHPGLPQRVDIFFELYGKTKGFEPELDMALFLKAETLYNDKSYEQAAVILENIDADQLDPEYRAEMLYKRGWSLSESGNFDRAAASFGRFLADFPTDPRRAEVLNKRGQAFTALGDRTSALRDFEEVLILETTPELTVFALQGAARSLREEKKYEAMIARYRRLLADYQDLPKDTIANANYWVGWGYYKTEKLEEVAPYIRNARDLVPEFYSQPAGNILILTAFMRRDKAALHTALQEVFSVAPEKFVPPLILSWVGLQMFHDDQAEAAADYLNRAADPNRPDRTEEGVWRTLAKAQNKVGHFQQALVTVRVLLSLKLEPIWIADAHLDLAEAQLGLGLDDDALSSAKKGLEMKIPGSHLAGLHLICGEVAARKQSWQESLSEFETTISMVPDDPYLQPRALAGAALAARELGNEEKAAGFENKLKTTFPNWRPITPAPSGE